ncbi:cytoskeleton assembly control protein SLA1 [Nannizzia gypsea CBS 118893]|uniref:Actin cytoskeleton-regulatory complex protein SLA1 n=1 Tax=Arthroderma gypseum (strain ATCC MYA-4604 / CBS 118893) TaxID=535722 RepID=E4UYC2_ARTGP|nr:cytoskeleton assembly control protein SLA1 [Nannizzia gypsea CBS 118893]EFR02085.1 cytoskeleton assembly control protein SLA1 [Nannizzia gypsea CBS 118893]
MGFEGVCTAVYDYTPQGENELAFAEGDLLYILDKSSDDGWWKAKKKTTEFESEEPVGLIPHNYVEEAQPIQQAKSIYDYTRQTDEEVSFADDVDILIFDTSDPDWTLVQVNSEYGFAPSNYIQVIGDIEAPGAEAAAPPAIETHKAVKFAEPEPEAQLEPEPEPEQEQETPPAPQIAPKAPAGPAAALAGILHTQQPSESRAVPPLPSRESPAAAQTVEPAHEDDEVEAPAPALPRRPPSQQESPREHLPSPREYRPPPSPRDHLHSPTGFSREGSRALSPHDSLKRESTGGVQPSPPYSRLALRDDIYPRHTSTSPSGYHIYNISEMISIMGKRKKMPTTLGINVAAGTIFISPEKSEDGPLQEWTAEKLKHYSIEGKHVFVDLVRPSKNVDFHAGAKDTAQEIVAALGEISGGFRAEGLREVIAAGTSGAKKKGIILYDFVAQGEDEVSVGVDDQVIILDDSRSEEWWMIRRVKNGREGVVPSSYIEITGVADSGLSGVNAGLSSVEQNRLEEARLAKQSTRSSKRQDSDGTGSIEVGPGVKLPRRRSSLGRIDGNQQSQRSRRESKSSKSKPNPAKTRKWTDRSGTFTVVAEFIGLADGKMHLHKQNGVKIAVPVSKMSIEDLEYVEKVTGESLDEDKPLSDIRRRSQMGSERKVVGASIKKEPEYDWFDFFLRAGVGPHQCERYASNFTKDSMDESVIPDITSDVLRTLGLKEGDIIRVMKYVEEKYKRKAKGGRNVTFADGDEEPAAGGLFSGPGGALRNNTRKGRPTPASQASDVVDPKAFTPKDKSEPAEGKGASTDKEKDGPTGFEDDAWEVKTPTKPAASTAPSSAPTAAASQPALTGAMADLSLLQTPLEPTKTAPAPAAKPAEPAVTQPPATQAPPAAQPQNPGANPQFFAQLGQPQMQAIAPQMTGYVQPQLQPQQTAMPPRQRPQPPTTAANQGFLTPPPPPRPFSAPNNQPAPNGFVTQPLQPQLTGIPSTAPHIAPPGHSLAELNQQRFQQQQLAPQPTGFPSQVPGMTGQFGSQVPFMNSPQQFMGGQQQPFQTSSPAQQGFPALAPQPTGYPQFGQQQQPPMPTGSINSVLPTPLQPQRTGANGFGINPSFTPSPPPIPQQPAAAPLLPQKTGPAPPVRFGVHKDAAAKKIMPQPTGKANLAQATPSNPFGFA